MSIDSVLKLFKDDALSMSSSENFYLMQLFIQAQNNDVEALNKIIEMRDAATEQPDIDFFQSLIDSIQSVEKTINLSLNFSGTVSGITGAQGETGLRGILGETGIQGEQGDTGVSVQGETGYKGIQGETGAGGITGTTGIGLPGEKGPRGYTGIQGVKGIQGETGSQGTTGIQGIQGITGAKGLDGSFGQDGFQGIRGETGLDELGETGIQGEQGIKGEQGTTGIAIQGETGIQGATGLYGYPGEQGDTGPVVIGPQGTTGIQGVQGITGSAPSVSVPVVEDGDPMPTLVDGNILLKGDAILTDDTVVRGSLIIDRYNTKSLYGAYDLTVCGDIEGNPESLTPFSVSANSVAVWGTAYGTDVVCLEAAGNAKIGCFYGPNCIISTNQSLNPGNVEIAGEFVGKSIEAKNTGVGPATKGGDITIHGHTTVEHISTVGSSGYVSPVELYDGGNGGTLTFGGLVTVNINDTNPNSGKIQTESGGAGTGMTDGVPGDVFIKGGCDIPELICKDSGTENAVTSEASAVDIELWGTCHIGSLITSDPSTRNQTHIISPQGVETLLSLAEYSGQNRLYTNGTGYTMTLPETSGLSFSTNLFTTFTHITSGNGLPSNNCISVHYSSGKIYVGTDSGLAISSDSGATWITRTTSNGLGSDIIYDVLFYNHPDTVTYPNGIILAGTSNGLSRSIDGGVNFTNTLSGKRVHSIAPNSTYNTYFLATNDFLYKTTNYGVSCSKVFGSTLTDLGNDWRDVYVLDEGNTILAAVHSDYRSGTDGRLIGAGAGLTTNGGSSWTVWDKTDGLGHSNCYAVLRLVSPTRYLVGTQNGLSITDDGGATWVTKTTADGLGSNLINDLDGSFDFVVAATTGGISTCTDITSQDFVTVGIGSNKVNCVDWTLTAGIGTLAVTSEERGLPHRSPQFKGTRGGLSAEFYRSPGGYNNFWTRYFADDTEINRIKPDENDY